MITKQVQLTLIVAVTVAMVWAGAGSVTNAGNLQYEGFDYNPGDLNPQGGWGNFTADARTGIRQVTTGSFLPGGWTLPAGATVPTGNKVEESRSSSCCAPAQLQFNAAAQAEFASDGSGGTIYIGAVLQGNGNFHFGSAAGQPQATTLLDGGPGNGFIGAANADFSGDSVDFLRAIGGGNPFYAVWKATHDGGPLDDTIEMSLITNGALGAEPGSWDRTKTKQWNTATPLYFHEVLAGGGADRFVDELAISTTWEGLFVIPEPASLALLVLGVGLVLLPRRWRAIA